MSFPRRRALRRSGSQTGGYSLIELLVASTFLTIGIVGSLMVHSAARGLRRTAAETREATVTLGNVMEEMRTLSPAEVVDSFEDGVAISYPTSPLNGLTVVPTYPGFVAGDGTIEIELTASWVAFDGSLRSITFESAL